MDKEDKENLQDSSDLIFEEEDGGVEASSAEKLKKLRSELRACETKCKEYLDGWQRSKAEIINVRKDVEKQRVEFVKYAEGNLVEKILQPLESLLMAVAGSKNNQSLPKEWRDGLQMIEQQFIGTLREFGLEEIRPSRGDIFDPLKHNAVNVIKIENEEEDNTIHEVLQTGFSFRGKLLKAANVIVKNK